MIDSFLSKTNLELKENGIWFAANSTTVSYPKSGNQFCFEIEEKSYWFQHRNDCILIVLQHFPPTGIFFDLGGGNGFVASAIQQTGIDVVLLEPGIEGAKNARRRGVKTVICSTLEDAGFADNALPAAGLFDVIEHVADDTAFLKRLWNLLTPGGRIYLTTPAYNFLWSNEDEIAGHFRRYTVRTLRRTLENLRFKIDFAGYIFAVLPLPIFLFRTLPTKFSHHEQNAGESEHHLPSGFFGRAFRRILGWELDLLNRKSSIPFGGSCLIVASKQ